MSIVVGLLSINTVLWNKLVSMYVTGILVVIVVVSTGYVQGAPKASGVGCEYDGQTYKEGDTWQDGCKYSCTCLNETTKHYSCQALCPTWTNIPEGCKLQTLPGECCPKPVCKGGVTLTVRQMNACSYKGLLYRQGTQWKDGCDYNCSCVDGATGYYRCSPLCKTYSHIPERCKMRKVDECCSELECPPDIVIVGVDTATKKSVTSTNTDTANITETSHKTNDSKTIESKPKKPAQTEQLNDKTSVTSIQDSKQASRNVAKTGISNGVCRYKGMPYREGTSWRDGCDYNCTCVDGHTGHYRCTSLCKTYLSVPAECKMTKVDECCSKPVCPDNVMVPVETITSFEHQTTDSQNATVNNTADPKSSTQNLNSEVRTEKVTKTERVVEEKPKISVPVVVRRPSTTTDIIQNVCNYKGMPYREGTSWRDGCDYNCTCVDGHTGHYRCTSLCKTYSSIPKTCKLEKVDSCCSELVCPKTTVTPQAKTEVVIEGHQNLTTEPKAIQQPINSGESQSSGKTIFERTLGIETKSMSNTCEYNGAYYEKGDQWTDGCKYRCTCVDGSTGYYKCLPRCKIHKVIPQGCTLQKIDECCSGLVCNGSTKGTTTDKKLVNQTIVKPADSKLVTRVESTENKEGITLVPPGIKEKQPEEIITIRKEIPTAKTDQTNNSRRLSSKIIVITKSRASDVNGTPAENGTRVLKSIEPLKPITDKTTEIHVSSGTSTRTITDDKPISPANSAKVAKPRVLAEIMPYNQCKYNGQSYNQGDTWKDGCDYNCTCKDGSTGHYSCQSLCKTFDTIPEGCVLKKVDECCSELDCQVTNEPKKTIPINSTEATSTSKKSIQQPPIKSTSLLKEEKVVITKIQGLPSEQPVDRKNMKTIVLERTPESVLITNSNGGGCRYHGKLYQEGDRWRDGCKYDCSCVNADTGYYKCERLCKTYTDIPEGCVLQKVDECCSELVCNGKLLTRTKSTKDSISNKAEPLAMKSIVLSTLVKQADQKMGQENLIANDPKAMEANTLTRIISPTTVKKRGCEFNGTFYKEGEQWHEGCSYNCTCIDGDTGSYRCISRCKEYPHIPPGCTLRKIDECCHEPECPSVGASSLSKVADPKVKTTVEVGQDSKVKSNLGEINVLEVVQNLQKKTENDIKPVNATSDVIPTEKQVMKNGSTTEIKVSKPSNENKAASLSNSTDASKQIRGGVESDLMSNKNINEKVVSRNENNTKIAGNLTNNDLLETSKVKIVERTEAAVPVDALTDNDSGILPEVNITKNEKPVVSDTQTNITFPSRIVNISAMKSTTLSNQDKNKINAAEQIEKAVAEFRAKEAKPNTTSAIKETPSESSSSSVTASSPQTIAGSRTAILMEGMKTEISGMRLSSNIADQAGLDFCTYSGKTYKEGERWIDGCDYNCTCIDGTTGYFTCVSLCKSFVRVPNGCALKKIDECCSDLVCNTTNRSAVSGSIATKTVSESTENPAPRRVKTNACEYKGIVYREGETWTDGCKFNCTCMDSKTGYYTCKARCKHYPIIPQGCKLQKVDECCSEMVCQTDVNITKEAVSGSLSSASVEKKSIKPIVKNIAPKSLDTNDKTQKKDNTSAVKSLPGVIAISESRIEENITVMNTNQTMKTLSPNSIEHLRLREVKNNAAADKTSNPAFEINLFGPSGKDGFTASQASIEKAKVINQIKDLVDTAEVKIALAEPVGILDGFQTNFAEPNIMPTALAMKSTETITVNSKPLQPSNRTDTQTGESIFTAVETVESGIGHTDGFQAALFEAVPADGQSISKIQNEITSTGCVYNGTVYSEGTRWRDGCTFDCRCMNGSTGYYTCQSVCKTYSGLPEGCTLQKVDECCFEPVCPNTVTIESGPVTINNDKTNVAAEMSAGSVKRIPGNNNLVDTAVVTHADGLTKPENTSRIMGCRYGGKIHAEGEEWLDGCRYNCTCVDGNTGYYKCVSLCKEYKNIPAGCSLRKIDNCCSEVVCENIVIDPLTATANNKPGTTKSNTTTSVMEVITKTLTNQGMMPGDGFLRPPKDGFVSQLEVGIDHKEGIAQIGRLVTQTAYCSFNGRLYQQGEWWLDGCNYNCTCEDENTGLYRCNPRCKRYVMPLPDGCSLQKVDECCSEPVCPGLKMTIQAADGTRTVVTQINNPAKVAIETFKSSVQSSQTSPGSVLTGSGASTKVLKSNVCNYNGTYYKQGDTWTDGCKYRCTCVDSSSGLYRCNSLCKIYTNIPDGCTLRKVDECCYKPDCSNPSSSSGTGASTNAITAKTVNQTNLKNSLTGASSDNNEIVEAIQKSSSGTSVTSQQTEVIVKIGNEETATTETTNNSGSGGTGMILSKQGRGGKTGAGQSDIPSSGAGCKYRGIMYKQGDTWKDGCKYNCKCVNGKIGYYACRELCVKWSLPKECHIDPPVEGKCCGKPVCPGYITIDYPPGYVQN